MYAIPLIHSPQLTIKTSIVMERFGFGRASRLTSPAVTSSAAKLAYTKLATSKLKWIAYIHSFGAQFEPRYIFRAGRLDQ